jgi:capsular exopolysaccharide synthesis family protein
MELKRYLSAIRRWVWLLVLGMILGGAGGFMGSNFQTPLYQSNTRFVILRAAQASTDYYAYLDSMQLVQTYIQLLTTDQVLQDASAELGYPVYAGQATAQQIPDTQFVSLTVQDTNPQHAADIANVMVSILIERNEQLQATRYLKSEENLQVQVDQVQSHIDTLQNQINEISATTVEDQLLQVQAQVESLQTQVTTLEAEIADLKKIRYPTDEEKAKLVEKESTLAQIQPVLALYKQVYTNLVVLGQPVDSGANTTTQLEQLQTTLNLYQSIYLNLLNSLEAVRLARVQNTPNVVQVEPATVSNSPISPHPIQTATLAAVIGLLLASGVAFVVEYFDDTLKTMEDVERTLKLPVIGYIAEIKYDSGSNESLYVARQPRSPVSEAFRLLRTNLEFAGVDHPMRRILVTSAGPGEGKTTVSVNLAAIIAQSGKRVTLIDADLRRPKVHRFLRLSNKVGLSNLFRSPASVQMVSQTIEGLDSFSVITSGSLPPNPAELLSSARMEQILQEIEQVSDVVIIDSPPSLVADVQVLAAKVSGVIMVIHPGHTQSDTALANQEMLKRAGAHVIGVVLNRIPRARADYYGGYRHYSSYYASYPYESGEEQTTERTARHPKASSKKSSFQNNGHKNAEEAVLEKTARKK